MIKRALTKTFSYGTMHMVIAITVAYLLSGDWKVALAIGFIEPVVQTIGYFFHERAWHRFETKRHECDPHNVVINSVSPASDAIEEILREEDGTPCGCDGDECKDK